VLLFLGVGLQQGYSQILNSRLQVLVFWRKRKRKMGKWSDLELVNVVVSLDTDKSRIVIYSQIIQLFEIIEYHQLREK
jgi:hypothetical protein